MKILFSAIALSFAVPSAAQPASAAPQHPHHTNQPAGPASAAQGSHAQHQMPQGNEEGRHEGHDMGGGCCADRDGNGKMDCCENMAAGSGSNCCRENGERAPAQQQPAQPQAHQNH